MEPRYYQSDSVACAWEAMADRSAWPIIVLPTGSGKSFVIALLIIDAITKYGGRVIVLAHRQELLEQNAAELRSIIPGYDVGVYSAGLNSRDVHHDVVFAGIQSAHKVPMEFGIRHLILIDEVHLVPWDKEKSMYMDFIQSMVGVFERTKVVGLTATPFRSDNGDLIGGGSIFSEICYEAKIEDLINQGFLCNVTNSPGDNSVDASSVSVRRGEFVERQLMDLFSESKNALIADEIIAHSKGKKGVMVFCVNVEHADQMCRLLEEKTGERCELVTGSTGKLLRKAYVDDFVGQHYRFIVNVNVLTTGFNAKHVDLIAVCRATQSAGLFAQIVGRGLRVSPGKEVCEVLDFGGNIDRHGPINSPTYGRKVRFEKVEGNEEEEKEYRICEACNHLNPIELVACEKCGQMLDNVLDLSEEKPDPTEKLEHQPDKESSLIDIPKDEIFEVEVIMLSEHVKRETGKRSLRIDYTVNGLAYPISEWICLEHAGFARTKAIREWSKHCLHTPPDTVHEAMAIWEGCQMRMPTRISARKEGRFFRIVDKFFVDDYPPMQDVVKPEAIFAQSQIVSPEFDPFNDWEDPPF